MKKFFFVFAVLFFNQGDVLAQCNLSGSGLTATVTASPANCPLTGSVAIAVTGSASGAPYTFILSGSCLSVPVTQSQASPNYTFTSLQGGCTYTVCISDAGGNIISKPATVAINYSVLTGVAITDTMFTAAACSRLAAAPAGGTAPYSYELFLGTGAGGSPVQGPQASNVFTGVNPTTQYTVRVTDACNQSIIAVHFTGSLIPVSLNANSGSAVLESCTSMRVQISLNNSYGGTDFSDNDIGIAGLAGLKFPVVITAKDHNGQVISGYPYTLTGDNPAPWGQSPNAGLFPDLRWSPPLPNNPSLFPVTFSYASAGCSAGATGVCTYNDEFAKAAYPFTSGSFTDTTQCPFKSCFRFSINGNYIAGNFYLISVYNNPATTGTPAGTINYPGQSDICGLARGTTYYFKVHDPCLSKDTVLAYTTAPAFAPFTIMATNCNTYCSGSVQAQFSYTGPGPNSASIDSGPASYGPYPKTINLPNSSLGVNSNLDIGNLPGGAYHFTFHTKCGETAVSTAVFEDGNLFASPVHSVTNTGCGSALVTITPHVSATGKVLDYHTVSPGCHSMPGVAFYSNIIFTQLSAGSPIPGSGNIQVDNPNDGYSVNVNSPGVYIAKVSYSEGLPGLNNAVSNCYQTKSDTFAVTLPGIPTIAGFYTLPCAGNTYSIIPVAPTAVTGTTYTLYAPNGTSILGGPQLSNVFNNVSTSIGSGLTVKATDPCGQSSVAPVSQNSSTSIGGSVHCFTYMSGGVAVAADSLKADFINGASYLWTAPDGTTYTGSNPPPVIPAQAGNWSLATNVQAGTCSTSLSNSFTSVICTQSGATGADPREDTIHLSGSVSLCKTTLTWITQQEINSLSFDVEASDDNMTWVLIYNVAAAGNSSTPRAYSVVTDPSAKHKFYRVRQRDTDGHIKFSNTVEINTDCSSGTDILTGTNPITDGVFSFYFPASVARGNTYLLCIDAIGREYFRRASLINRGMNIYSFRPQQVLAKGTYFVRLVSADGRWFSNTVKVVYVK